MKMKAQDKACQKREVKRMCDVNPKPEKLKTSNNPQPLPQKNQHNNTAAQKH